MPTLKMVIIELILILKSANLQALFLVIAGETIYHRMCDTDPGRQCIVNEEWHSVRCYCNTDNCNADEKCNCDDSTTTTQVPETTSITDGATDLTLSLSVFIASMIIRNF